MTKALSLLLAGLAPLAGAGFDVVVYGGTPGGVMAAVAAARMGHSVALVEYHHHVGGMTASGLGKSDVETRDAIGGLFREFVTRVRDHYAGRYGEASENFKLCRDGYYYEPSVAEKIFHDMLAGEKNIALYTGYRIEEAGRSGNRVAALRARNRKTGAATEFRGRVFIDASYEGDLAAYAGARYRLGRESRSEFNELHAGVVYQDYETRTFLPGTTGEGDRRVQAYTYRLCLTTDPANSRVLTRPPGYDRSVYTGYLDDWKAGRMGATKDAKPGRGYYAPTFGTVVRALSMADLPNRKLDVNMNPRPLGFPFAGENYEYPEADWDQREQIAARLRDMTLGLLYFLQNDSGIPEEHRKLARRFNLPRDEFTDNGNFPWQLYVREARRIVGLYTLSENDLISPSDLGRPRIHADSIAAGEFPIDSFPVRKREPGHDKALEGYILMLDEFTRPYQVPYRILVPETVDALLVPVAVSATHVAFSTIRMEPQWMVIGHAAGLAAHLAIRSGREPRAIDVAQLQRLLLRQGQVLTFFTDLDPRDPAHHALQWSGTKGFFREFAARPRDALDRAAATAWLRLPGVLPPGLPMPHWPAEGLLSRADVAAWLGKRASLWTHPANARTAVSDPVWRAEFCKTLFDVSARKEH